MPNPARTAVVLAGLTPLLCAGVLVPVSASATPVPAAAPLPAPARTSIALSTPFGHFGTTNAAERRPALSEIKMYMADYILDQGDGSQYDRQMCERMIRFSDDDAAQAMWDKYGAVSVQSPAAYYGLTSTYAGGNWGVSDTSAADMTRFLDAKRAGDPGSPILAWMTMASPVAADGTRQNWGTATIPGVYASKWGWSDRGPSVVASASFGRDFSMAAITYGTPDAQTADVQGAVDRALPPLPVPDTTGSLGTAQVAVADAQDAVDVSVGRAQAQVGLAIEGLRSGLPASGVGVPGLGSVGLG